MGLFGIFRTIHMIYSVISLILTLLLIYIVALAYTASQTEITNVVVSNVTNITKDGFTLTGGVTVKNGGIVTMHIKEVTYGLTLEDGPVDLGTGTVEGARLMPKEELRFEFTHRVNLSKSVAQALTVKGNSSNVAVEGDVVLDHFGLYESKLHYKSSFDLLQTIVTQAEELLPLAITTANSFLNTLNELLN